MKRRLAPILVTLFFLLVSHAFAASEIHQEAVMVSNHNDREDQESEYVVDHRGAEDYPCFTCIEFS